MGAWESFAGAQRWFACPNCGAPLELDGRSLVCGGERRHCFDIARQGYVNLDIAAKKSPFYDRDSFEARQRILSAGYYGHIRDAVLQAAMDGRPADATYLDVGCGEGYYSRELATALAAQPAAEGDVPTVLAFDISKDSVQLAAREDRGKRVKWFVGNLGALPLRDESVDCILDIFSPANYAEFERVLKPGGIVVKAVPGNGHVRQLRELAAKAGQLRHEEYSNEEVVEAFERRFAQARHATVSRTCAMPPEDVGAFARMTPLFFNVAVDGLALESIGEITVEAELLVGTKQ